MSVSVDIKDKAFRVTIGTAVAVVVFIVGSTVWFLNLKEAWENKLGDYGYRLGTAESTITKNDARISQIEQGGFKRDLQLNSYQIKLENIESTLLEIKSILTRK